MSVKLSYDVYYMRATWCYGGAYTQYNIRGYDQTFYFNHESTFGLEDKDMVLLSSAIFIILKLLLTVMMER